MSNSGQLENEICKVLLPMEEAGIAIDLDTVAHQTILSIDPGGESPLLVTFSAVQHIKNAAGKLLAKRHDPVQKAKDHIKHGGENDDLFGADLQPYYPVKRSVEDDGKEVVQSFYIPREELTEIDVVILAKKMDKAGQSLQKHARALQAWFVSKEDVA